MRSRSQSYDLNKIFQQISFSYISFLISSPKRIQFYLRFYAKQVIRFLLFFFSLSVQAHSSETEYKLYLSQNDVLLESEPVRIETETGIMVLNEIYQDENGFYVLLNQVLSKSEERSTRYCPKCTGKFFSDSEFRKHSCRGTRSS